MIVGAWVLFAIVMGVTCFFTVSFVRYLSDKHEAELLPYVAAVLTLSIALFIIFLVPIDVYNVSSYKSTTTGDLVVSHEVIIRRDHVMEVLYSVLYAVMLTCMFVAVPFAYFYYEEDDEDVTVAQKAAGAAKYTIFTVVIVALLLLVGFIVKPFGEAVDHKKGENTLRYLEELMGGSSALSNAISFTVGAVSLMGLPVWLFYTAPGLAVLPIGILKGKKSLSIEGENVRSQLDIAREQGNAIRSKYNLTGRSMSRKDRRQLDKLQRQERLLSRRSARLDEENTGTRWLLTTLQTPFLWTYGVVGSVMSVLLIVSVITSQIDRWSRSECGASCGYAVGGDPARSPLNWVLTSLAKAHFPLDYIFYGIMVLHVLVATVTGIQRLGIRFLWVSMYRIRPRASVPQGVLLTVVLLALVVTCWNLQLMTIATTYVSFGSQVVREADGSLASCGYNALSHAQNCTLSQVAVLGTRVTVGFPVMGLVQFYTNWGVVAVFALACVYGVLKTKGSILQEELSDASEDDD